MLVLWESLALFSSISAILALGPLFILLFGSARGYGETVLCMDCQQCVAVCPVREAKGTDYMGPHGIMKTARVDHRQRAADEHLYSCTSCMSCSVACPRGLNVEHMMIGFRKSLAESGLGQLTGHKRIIERVGKYGNPYSEDMSVPTVESQADDIRKHVKGYGKRIGLDLDTSNEKAVEAE
ncbi:MAG: 4Fe-4S dicluster domain-containing protein [Halobacteriota archaeon]|nr:4Fe-4S dicluster domain-containing protein [Halobacteriota archaeon]